MRFLMFFRFRDKNQKKMFDDCDDFWRVYKGHYGVIMLLRGKIIYNEEARNMGLNGFSFLKQIKKKMFDDRFDFLGMGGGYGDTFTLLRGKINFNEEARNMGLNTFSFS